MRRTRVVLFADLIWLAAMALAAMAREELSIVVKRAATPVARQPEPDIELF